MKIEHSRFVTPFQGYSALKGRNIIAQGKTLGLEFGSFARNILKNDCFVLK